jgi:hypothetical protein
METGGNIYALERLCLFEPLSDQSEHRHVPLGPFYPLPALFGQSDILDMSFDCHCFYASFANSFALSVFSHVKLGSVRPK